MKLTQLALFLLLIHSCTPESKQFENHFHLTCSGENISDTKFVEGSEYLSNANCRSKNYSRTGSYGFKLNNKVQFGPSFHLKSIKKGDVIYASVWRKKGSEKGKLVIASNDQIQYKSDEFAVRVVGDWEELNCSFVARQNFDDVAVYIWNPTEKDVYFDDLTIDCYRGLKKPEHADEKDILRIDIPNSAMDSIEGFRNKALEQDIISSELKSYFDASIQVGGEKIPVSLRLKGDWVDHLEGNKWSFRIKLKGNNSYYGLKKFSIQDPSTRSFMMEWFAHQLFEKEDILTTRYQFKVVYINGVNKGVYALEEHFNKRLLEYRNQREGPIVKFDESGIWQARLDQKKTGNPFIKYPYLESSEILPFSKKRTRKNPVLLKQFMLAKSHMDRYRNRDEALEEYMDIDKMARFLALCDVMNATHGLIWHNQRHYLNPVKGCLEPVAYDCFTTDLIVEYGLLGKATRWRSDKDFTILDALFLNPEFDKLYTGYLQKFSKDSYILESYQDFDEEIKHYEALLRHEYPMYKLDRNYFETNRLIVHKEALAYEKLPPVHRTVNKTGVYKNSKQEVVFDKAALNVSTIDSDSLSCKLQFENYLLADIEIVGYSTKKNKNLVLPFSPSFVLRAFKDKAQKKVVSYNFRPKNIFYKTASTGDSLIKSKISSFPPVSWVTAMDIDAEVLKVKAEQGVMTLKGTHTFYKTVYVPRNRSLVIEPGTKIDLRNGARFVSYSPVQMNGSKNNPIEFFSSDKKGGGVVILPGGGEVVFRNVNFLNLTAGNTENWILTGAVTVYEGDVQISNCSFKNNQCEDALNLIRCQFKMDSSLIANTQSDGFDADFCTGSITSSKFVNTGNDCVDFSGSDIVIEFCDIKGSGDKGISGGEGSKLWVKDCSIQNASIAIASKDFSHVEVQNTSITNCSYAFAAYKKKAEFGPSKLVVKSATLTDVKSECLIELDSEIIFNGKNYVGKESFDIDSMYQVFNKGL